MTKKELQEQMDKMQDYYDLQENSYIEEVTRLKVDIRTYRLYLRVLLPICIALAINLILTWI